MASIIGSGLRSLFSTLAPFAGGRRHTESAAAGNATPKGEERRDALERDASPRLAALGPGGVSPSDAVYVPSTRGPGSLVECLVQEGKGARQPAIAGRLTMPGLVLRPLDILNRVRDGKLTVRLPLRPGVVLVPVPMCCNRGIELRIRPGTVAELTMTVRDGALDRESTEVRLLSVDAREGRNIRAPLWVRIKGLHIDAERHLMAELAGWWDQNLTQTILGPGNIEVPAQPGTLLSMVNRNTDLFPPSVGGNDCADGTEALLPETLEVLEAKTLVPAAAERSVELPLPSAAVGGSSVAHADLRNDVDDMRQTHGNDRVDLSGLDVSFTGTLVPGPLSIGKGSMLHVGDGTQVTISHGNLARMKIGLEGHFDDVELKANGSRWRSKDGGRAHIDLDIATGKSPHGEEGPEYPGWSKLAFRDFDLGGLEITTPADDSHTHTVKLSRLSIRADPDIESVLVFEAPNNGAGPHLMLEVKDVAFQGIETVLHVRGAQGQPGVLAMGNPAGDSPPMNVRGSLRLDSSEAGQVFELAGKIDNSVVRLDSADPTGFGLADSPAFGLAARDIELVGSGAINVKQPLAHRPRLSLTTKEGEAPWNVRLVGCRGHVGHSGLPLQAEVSDAADAPTQGLLELSELRISPEGHPVFSGSGKLAVAVKRLSYEGDNGEMVEVASGSTGTLEIGRMRWGEHEAFPQVDAILKLRVGGEVKFTAERIKTLEGAGIVVKAEPGGTSLELAVKLDRDGIVGANARVDLRSALIRTSVEKVHVDHPQRPERALDVPAADTLPQRRPPARRPVDELKPLELTEELREARRRSLSLRDVPALELAPQVGPAIKALKSATIDARLPLGEMKGFEVPDARVRLTTGCDAEATVHFEADDGHVRAGVIELKPPVLVSYGMLSAEVSKIEVVRDVGTGEFYALPSASLQVGWLPLGSPTWLNRKVGGWAMEGIVGTSAPPSDLSEFFELLARRYPSAKDGIHVAYRPSESFGSAESDESSDADTVLSWTTAPSTNASASAVGPTDASEAVDFRSATLDVDDVRFDPFVLPLGGGQSISCGSGTELRVSHRLGETVVEGVVDLAPAVVGARGHPALRVASEDGHEVRLDRGRARLHVVYRDGPPAACRIELSELDVDRLVLSGPVGGAEPRVEVDQVEGGSISIASHNGKTDVDVDLSGLPSGTRARIVSEGMVAAENVVAGAERLDASVEVASLRFKDGALSARLRQAELHAREMVFATSNGEVSRGTVKNLRGQGQVRIGADGTYSFVLDPCEGDDAIDIDEIGFALADGSRFGLHGARATAVTIAQGGRGGAESVMRAEGVDAHGLSALVAVDNHVSGDMSGRVERLQVRDGRLHGGVFEMKDGAVSLKGDVTRVDASLVNVQASAEMAELDAEQLNVVGDAAFDVASDTITLAETQPGSLNADGVLRRFHVVTQAPELDLEVSGHRPLNDERKVRRQVPPCLAGDLSRVVIGKGVFEIDFRNAWLRGRLDHGTATVGPADSTISRVSLDRGEVDVEVDRVHAVDKPDQAEPAFEFRGKIRVDGHVQDTIGEPPPPPDTPEPSDRASDEKTATDVAAATDSLTLAGRVLLTTDAWFKDREARVASAVQVREGVVNLKLSGSLGSEDNRI